MSHYFNFTHHITSHYIYGIDLCSHRRSWWFWAESVAEKNTMSFHSIKAKSWDDFKKGRTDDSYIIRMGYDCPLK